jgi:hypothetical protein
MKFNQEQATLYSVIARTTQQERRLELRGGGVLERWSLDSPDAGRGRAYAALVVDEAAMVPNLDQAALVQTQADVSDLFRHRDINSRRLFVVRRRDDHDRNRCVLFAPEFLSLLQNLHLACGRGLFLAR